jgi:glutamate synthase (NADPH) small chain
MSDPSGFKKYNRKEADKRKPYDRINDYNEIYLPTNKEDIDTQSARCMTCGIPFCHSGCPLGNKIPDFNDAVHQGKWKSAYHILSQTNNFPEFTGRICPAPCEASCVLGLNNDAVTIELIEKNIIETAFENNWVLPHQPSGRTFKKIAIIGSGPSGLAAADQLCQMGHDVFVYEKSDKVGGLLRFGIPDFKLEKWVIERRIDLMEKVGVKFITNCEIGKDITMEYLRSNYDAIAICIGAGVPRDIGIEGREASGIHFAMDFLSASNHYVANPENGLPHIHVKNKKVVVIGGGDTGADCVGTSHRQGAASVTQLEVMYKPNASRTESDPWPRWPMILRTSSSHEEGGSREWSILTKAFLKNEKNQLIGIKTIEVEWSKNPDTGQYGFNEITGTEKTLECDVAFLAVGFLHGNHAAITLPLSIDIDNRGNIATKNYHSSLEGVFAAGDARRGQSLVVWAIAEGRECAQAIDQYLSSEAYSDPKHNVLASYKM